MLSDDQKKQRVIGGSTIPQIVGRSKFGTALDAYLEIRGEKPEIEATEDMDRGNFLEDPLRQWFKKKMEVRTGVAVTIDVPKDTLRHPSLTFATYSPDGLAKIGNEEAVLEIKSPGPWAEDNWGEEWTDQVPETYAIQGAWGMLVSNRERCYFAALIGGSLRIFIQERDLELERVLVAKAAAFYEDHILKGIPPPLTFGDDEYISKKFPRSQLDYIVVPTLTEQQNKVIQEYLKAYRIAKETEKIKDTFEVSVKEIVENHTGIQGEGWRIDWKSQKDSMKVDLEAVVADLKEHVNPTLLDSLLHKYARVVPGKRPFRPYFKKEV